MIQIEKIIDYLIALISGAMVLVLLCIFILVIGLK
jgi:hypothetical protein